MNSTENSACYIRNSRNSALERDDVVIFRDIIERLTIFKGFSSTYQIFGCEFIKPLYGFECELCQEVLHTGKKVEEHLNALEHKTCYQKYLREHLNYQTLQKTKTDEILDLLRMNPGQEIVLNEIVEESTSDQQHFAMTYIKRNQPDVVYFENSAPNANTASNENQSAATCENDEMDVIMSENSEVNFHDIACTDNALPLSSNAIDEKLGCNDIGDSTRFKIAEGREQEGSNDPGSSSEESVACCSKDRGTAEEGQFHGKETSVSLITKTKQEKGETDFATILEEFAKANEKVAKKYQLRGQPSDPEVSQNVGFIRMPNDTKSLGEADFQEDAKENEDAIENESPPTPKTIAFARLREDQDAVAADSKLEDADITTSKREVITVTEVVDETQQCDIMIDEFKADDIASLEDSSKDGGSDYEPTITDHIDNEDTTDNSDESESGIECTKIVNKRETRLMEKACTSAQQKVPSTAAARTFASVSTWPSINAPRSERRHCYRKDSSSDNEMTISQIDLESDPSDDNESYPDKQYPNVDLRISVKGTVKVCKICNRHFDSNFLPKHERWCRSRSANIVRKNVYRNRERPNQEEQNKKSHSEEAQIEKGKSQNQEEQNLNQEKQTRKRLSQDGQIPNEQNQDAQKGEGQNQENQEGQSLARANEEGQSKEEKTPEKQDQVAQEQEENISFQTNADSTNADSNKTVKEPYSCDYCQKRFSRARNLELHRMIHTGERTFECDVCGIAFMKPVHLQSHKRTHTGEKPFSCTVCGKSFTQSWYLRVHSMKHTGEKPHSCAVCCKSFNRPDLLKHHEQRHSGATPYQCDQCGKGFVILGCLERHKTVHTGEKPHSCEECGKSFAQLEHLKRHKKVHSGEKPHCCSVCSRSFARASHLKRHNLTHSGNRPHQCDICKKTFNRADTLTNHLKVHGH